MHYDALLKQAARMSYLYKYTLYVY